MWAASHHDQTKQSSKQSLFSKVRITTTKETATFPMSDTPATPMTPLGSHKYRSDDDSERKAMELGVDEAPFAPSEGEKTVMPHYSSVGGEC